MEQGHYHDIESISLKWQKIHPVVNRFAAIYNNLYTSNRRSRMSDEDVFKETMRKYKYLHRVVFPYVRAWDVLRTNNKWAPIPNEIAMAKQTKISETGGYSAGSLDARCQININDEPEFDEEEYEVRGEARPPGGIKPKRRRRQKKKSRNGGGGRFQNGRVYVPVQSIHQDHSPKGKNEGI
ncbi:hypothetical protein HanIR_Chr05g0222431 [Helianthus annuus]|nr:hypothetical protein HanIR_Chr05g0222431 [Helianthus annuus]